MDKQAEKYKDIKMPFDIKRMAVGGFKVVVSSQIKFYCVFIKNYL